MRSAFLILLAITVGVMLSVFADAVFSALGAQTLTPAPVPATNTLLTMLAAYGIEIIQAVAPIFVLWITIRLRKLFGLQEDAKLREGLQIGLENAAGKMVQSAGSAAQTLLIGSVPRNKALAEGLAYIEQAAPDAIKHFGLNRDNLIEKLEAQIGLKVAEQPQSTGQ